MSRPQFTFVARAESPATELTLHAERVLRAMRLVNERIKLTTVAARAAAEKLRAFAELALEDDDE